jgi:hypothetical protein
MRPLSKRVILRELNNEIRSYRSSYAEQDGVIRDRDALKTIAALEEATAMVRRCPPMKTREGQCQ